MLFLLSECPDRTVGLTGHKTRKVLAPVLGDSTFLISVFHFIQLPPPPLPPPRPLSLHITSCVSSTMNETCMCGLLHLFHPDRSVLVDWSLNTEQRNTEFGFILIIMSILVDWASDTEHGNTEDLFWVQLHVTLTYKYILLNSAILLKKYLSFVLGCIIMAYIFFAVPVRVRGVYWNHQVTVSVSVSVFACVLRFTVDSTV